MSPLYFYFSLVMIWMAAETFMIKKIVSCDNLIIN